MTSDKNHIDTNDKRDVLERILKSYVSVSSTTVDLIWESGELSEVKKNDVVFAENRFNSFEYFQLSGVSHRYNTDKEKQVLTTGIFQQEAVITPHFTRTINGQSLFSLQSLTDCNYLKIPSGIFRELMARNDQVRNFGRSVVEKEFVRSLQYEVLFRSFTAKDRLLYFREHYPQLENQIPHTVIASFLGITPVSFSRLRNEMTKK